MMDPAEAPEGMPCSAVMPPDPVSKVLDSDDLLIEIMVRLGFPTSLVHAALVCKHWFRHASDPAFLCRFRKLHPPRLLGFYMDTGERSNRIGLDFVPMLPQPPELAPVFRHPRFSLDVYKNEQPRIRYCWKNNILIYLDRYNGSEGRVEVVHNPLFPERGMAIVPRQPWHEPSERNHWTVPYLLIKEGGDSLSYFYVIAETNNKVTKAMVYVYMFQDGSWCMIISAPTELPCGNLPHPLLVDDKIYILPGPCSILVFDLRALSSSRIQLPQGVVCDKNLFTVNPLGLQCGGRTMLSPADDDLGVYLIHVNELQLVIWLYEGDNWLLVDTICLREMCADLRISDYRLANGNIGFVEIIMVGPNTEFVLLETPLCILHWDIKNRALRKVHEIRRYSKYLRNVHPIMMIWPPTFPVLKDDPARDDK